MTNVRDATRMLMRSWGATTVFGNPGSTELRFFSDWPGDFRYVLGLQESVVVAMADGFAQASGQVGIVNLHSAAGLGHALGSVHTAWRNQTPLLLTAGQQTRSLLPTEPYLHAREAASFPHPYVKWSCEPARGADVPAALARAYHTAMTPPRGPVFVSIPEDDWEVPTEPLPPRRVGGSTVPDPVLLTELAGELDGAARPALVLGAGVDAERASSLAVELAERLRAAVYVAPVSSRCSFPESHPCFSGFLDPTRRQVCAALAGHDLVLVVGAPVFTYHVSSDGPVLREGTRLFQITDNPDHAAYAAVGDSLLGSPRLALAALLELVKPKDGPWPEPFSRRPPPEETDPMSAETVLAALSGLLPAEAAVVEEAPTHRGAMHHQLPIERPGNFFVGASGGLGWGLPAACGVALADPGRPVVCLIGDGSLLYSVQALWTAAQHRLPLVVVVLDNQGYAALRSFSRLLGVSRAPGHDLPGVGFAALAEGFGCAARRVDDPVELTSALADALGAGEPVLLHVPVDASVRPIY